MRDAALGERLLEVDRLGVDARQQVVGEDDLLAGAGLRLLAGRFLVEDRGDERRGAALGSPAGCRSVTVSPDCRRPPVPAGVRIVRAN